MSNNIVKFSHNWNGKLNNSAFTTIRRHNPQKYKLGNTYRIELEGKIKGDAILTAMRIIRIDQLNDFICYLDTGYNTASATTILQRMNKGVDIKTVLFDLCLMVYKLPEKREPEAMQTKIDL